MNYRKLVLYIPSKFKNLNRIGFSFFLILLVGCGSQKFASSPVNRGTSASTNDSSTSVPLAECNRISYSRFNFTGQIGTYYDPLSGLFRIDFLNLNLATVPAEIFSSDNFQIQFIRWTQRSAGNRIENATPVRFYFRDKLTGAQSSNFVDHISLNVLTDAKKSFGATWTNITLTQFFTRASIVLTGMDLTYDAMTVRYYDTSVGELSRGDVLLPAFAANPSVFMTKRPFAEMYTLHPNYNLINSGFSDKDYFAQIEDICRELSAVGTRVPASEKSVDTNILSTMKIFVLNLVEVIRDWIN